MNLTKEQQSLTAKALRMSAERWDERARELSQMAEGLRRRQRTNYDALAEQMRIEAGEAREIARMFTFVEPAGSTRSFCKNPGTCLRRVLGINGT